MDRKNGYDDWRSIGRYRCTAPQQNLTCLGPGMNTDWNVIKGKATRHSRGERLNYTPTKNDTDNSCHASIKVVKTSAIEALINYQQNKRMHTSVSSPFILLNSYCPKHVTEQGLLLSHLPKHHMWRVLRGYFNFKLRQYPYLHEYGYWICF